VGSKQEQKRSKKSDPGWNKRKKKNWNAPKKSKKYCNCEFKAASLTHISKFEVLAVQRGDANLLQNNPHCNKQEEKNEQPFKGNVRSRHAARIGNGMPRKFCFKYHVHSSPNDEAYLSTSGAP
jgi:hypothetical protein